MEEMWKEVPNTESRYKASNLGNIYDNKLNKPVPYHKHKRGWLRCHIWIDGKRKTIGVHRVIMLTFYGESNLTVNHIDGNKENNRLDNLEYITVAENNKHRSKILKIGNRRKVKCLENGIIYDTILDASKELDLDPAHIGHVCRGERKYHKGYHFIYVD